jgi:hypothetical protein
MPIEKVCENCQQPFACFPSENRKYCGLACRSAHRFDKEIPEAQTPISFACAECGKSFSMQKSFVSAYHKKYDRDPLYCSRQCSGVGRRKTSEFGNTFVCLTCGTERPRRRKPGGRLYEQQKYCNHDCKVEGQKQNALRKFQRGGYKKHIKRHGYVWITVPELARTNDKRNVMEHRYVMSKHLGRDLLPEETVHHINGIRSENTIENLELFSSRHGPGQRVVDKVQFAIEILTLYPEFCRTAGYELHKITH